MVLEYYKEDKRMNAGQNNCALDFTRIGTSEEIVELTIKNTVRYIKKSSWEKFIGKAPFPQKRFPLQYGGIIISSVHLSDFEPTTQNRLKNQLHLSGIC